MIKKVFTLTTLSLATLLNADYVLEYKMDEATQKFMYHSASSSKLVTADSNSVYKIGKKTYMLQGSRVVDMDDMRKMADSFGYNPEEYSEKVSNFKPTIQKTSKRVTVGGIKGQEWIVSGKDDGEPYTQKVVVTDDKRVVKSVRAMNTLFTDMTDMGADSLELEKGYVIIKTDGMKLQSFKDMKVNQSEYQLPKNSKKQNVPTADSIAAAIEKAKKEYEAKEAKRTKSTDASQKKNHDEDIDKAANMLKSFF